MGDMTLAGMDIAGEGHLRENGAVHCLISALSTNAALQGMSALPCWTRTRARAWTESEQSRHGFPSINCDLD
jgi:hypothetical protein